MKGIFSGFLWVQAMTTAICTYREITVAMAAPTTPSYGKPSLPKIST